MAYDPILNRSDVQSIARTFPQGVSLVTSGRPNLRYIAIQNRDNKDVYFWHGEMPSGATGQGDILPLDPATWTVQQQTDAATFMQAYGEKITPGEKYEPRIAQTARLYSLVPVGTAICHVKQGE